MLRLAAPILALLLPLPALAGTWSQREIAGLDVRVYVPDGDGPRGLLVHLHGCSQDGADFQGSGNFEGAAEAHGVVVALPNVPGGGVIAGCWDYYGQAHDRTSRHNDDVLALVDALLADEALAVAPGRVYLSGLSSGGGQAWVLACLAPDVFAGVGLAAAPGLGTTTVTPTDPGVEPGEAAARCTSLAGERADAFRSQVASAVIGDGDTLVAPEAALVAARSFAALYGAEDESPIDVAAAPGVDPRGVGKLFADDDGPRVQWLLLEGLGHAWPAGGGQDGAFIEGQSLSYPDALLAFLEENNRRLDGEGGDDGDPVDGGPGAGGDAPPACACVSSGRLEVPSWSGLVALVSCGLCLRRRRRP